MRSWCQFDANGPAEAKLFTHFLARRFVLRLVAPPGTWWGLAHDPEVAQKIEHICLDGHRSARLLVIHSGVAQRAYRWRLKLGRFRLQLGHFRLNPGQFGAKSCFKLLIINVYFTYPQGFNLLKA